jgi:flagellar basal-body rod protein FlgC
LVFAAGLIIIGMSIINAQENIFQKYINENNLPIIIGEDSIDIDGSIDKDDFSRFLEFLSMNLVVISENIMHAQTTKTAAGGPYRRKYVDVADGKAEIRETSTKNRFVYDPVHPDAITQGDFRGYVEMPDVDIVTELTAYISAARVLAEVAHAGINYKMIDESAFEELMERINNLLTTMINEANIYSVR